MSTEGYDALKPGDRFSHNARIFTVAKGVTRPGNPRCHIQVMREPDGLAYPFWRRNHLHMEDES